MTPPGERNRGADTRQRLTGERQNERGAHASFHCRLPSERKALACPRRLSLACYRRQTEGVIPILGDLIGILLWCLQWLPGGV